MKVPPERRTFELRNGEWIEHPDPPARRLIDRLSAAAETAFFIAVVAATAAVAAGLALVLLPIASLIALLH